MKKDKKGFFERLIKGKKAKSGSCCGGFELEERPNESDINDSKNSNIGNKKGKKGCCSFELEEIPDERKINKDK